MITFEEYNLLENYIGNSNFKILLEKSLSNNINDKIKFGIVMATHKIKDSRVNKDRIVKMTTPDVLKISLGSIKGQGYKNWKLYLTADCYKDDEEIKSVMNDLISSDQLKYHNLSFPGERNNKKWTTKQIRYTAGCAALNSSLNMAKSDGCDYIVRLDHDDKWASHHLETLAKAYTQFPELAFVFTRSKKKIDSHNSSRRFFYQPQSDYKLDINNKGYSDNDVSHSATSWRPSKVGHLRYRNPDQQKGSEPKRSGIGYPADWDMFKRMMDKIKSNDLKYMYIPKVTSFYRNRKGEF
jgi:hypothetical protein